MPRYSLGSYLSQVSTDQPAPVPSLSIEFMESHSEHQFIEDRGSTHRIKSCKKQRAPYVPALATNQNFRCVTCQTFNHFYNMQMLHATQWSWASKSHTRVYSTLRSWGSFSNFFPPISFPSLLNGLCTLVDKWQIPLLQSIAHKLLQYWELLWAGHFPFLISTLTDATIHTWFLVI